MDDSGTKILANYYEIKERAETECKKLEDEEDPLILIGTATCGIASGALEVVKAFKEEMDKSGINARLIQTGCLGHCYAEPLVIIKKFGFPSICYNHINPVTAKSLVRRFLMEDDPCLELVLGALEENEIIPPVSLLPRFYGEKRYILKHCGLIDPCDINQYLVYDGYKSLATALEKAPEEITNEIKDSGLRGRGGAGFPTGRKLEFCVNASTKPKYIICNADEGDPGAFMDRAILESCPHQVLEGIIILAYTVGAEFGFIYIRQEYPLAVEFVEKALHQAKSKGFLGNNILNSNFNFDLKVFKGSGAFVCGEETALISSLEGKRGAPYHRPPYPAISGFKERPTLINNVKTLALVPEIIREGAYKFNKIGTEKSKGTTVFALVGKINNQGLIEVPLGITLRELIFDICGGIKDNKAFKAVQIGGPSGGCLPESLLDTPIDYDSLNASGAMMGSGGMVVMDEEDCMVDVTKYFLEFTQKESCGKCTFCRLGTKHMYDILERITHGEGKPEDLDFLKELAEDIKNGSLCNLGKTAPNPVLTTLRYFLDEYRAHIFEGRCPALKCRELIVYYIVPEKCRTSCDACVGTCPTEAIFTGKKGIKVIDQEKCIKCGECQKACPPEYDAIIKLSPPSLIPEE